ncbi:MAG TPA: CcmD family protein [Bacteroidia bacterium]|nr:CcmD family protein [Bacteroidia bacterium]HNS13475.1 CcmD family protein [Bacteroidia bacterium]
MRETTKAILYIFMAGLFIFITPIISSASDIEMADTMRSNGMIYVVIGVLSIIFLGILVFLMIIERRLKALEKASGRE